MNEPNPTTRPPTGDDPSNPAWRVFAIPALLALVGYVVFYACDARLRVTNGPWEVEFLQDTNGTPSLRINQERLGIHDVEIRFVGEQAGADLPSVPTRIRFDQPNLPVPFGRTAFDDLMFLPGTVVLHCFGHEVQLVPRTLYLDRTGIDWTNGARIHLTPAGKLPTLDPPPKSRLSGGRDRTRPSTNAGSGPR